MTFKVWGKDDVYLRFIEAAETFRRLPPVKLPKAFGNAMPDVVHDLADANRQEPERDKGEWNWKPARIPPKADAITRAGTTAEPRLRDALAATTDFPGVTGRTTIDAERNTSKPAIIVTVKNGHVQFVAAVTP